MTEGFIYIFFSCCHFEKNVQHYKSVPLDLPHLHFWVHAAVDGGNTPGWTGSDQAISCRREDGLLVLVEGLQWGILARTLQLVSTRQEEEKEFNLFHLFMSSMRQEY